MSNSKEGRRVVMVDESSGRKKREIKERIDFDQKEQMEITTDEEVDVYPSFDVMGLKEDLLRGIYSYGMRYVMYYVYTIVEFSLNMFY